MVGNEKFTSSGYVFWVEDTAPPNAFFWGIHVEGQRKLSWVLRSQVIQHDRTTTVESLLPRNTLHHAFDSSCLEECEQGIDCS